MSPRITRNVRSVVFGRDPEAYDRARLEYPSKVFDVLSTRCGLGPGARVFEIGPGTGIATRELLRRGAEAITLVEPDRRLARYLVSSLGPLREKVHLALAPFGRAKLPSSGFDLGVAASSFHWTSERRALRKVARVLTPGGWWAYWNNLHGDPYRSSPFNEALQPLYRELSGGRSRKEAPRTAAARDRKHRLAALRSVGRFDRILREDIRWSVTLSTARVVALWGTFSDVIVLSPRKRRWFLAGLAAVADQNFGGKVPIPMLTYLYTARRV